MHTVSDKTGDAILVVSFGTSYNDSREKTIGAIETAIADAFPKWSVRRAFTSRMIIRKLRERDGYRDVYKRQHNICLMQFLTWLT